jgi:hypothetical protein
VPIGSLSPDFNMQIIKQFKFLADPLGFHRLWTKIRILVDSLDCARTG